MTAASERVTGDGPPRSSHRTPRAEAASPDQALTPASCVPLRTCGEAAATFTQLSNTTWRLGPQPLARSVPWRQGQLHPPNSNVEVLSPAASACGLVWKQGLADVGSEEITPESVDPHPS